PTSPNFSPDAVSEQDLIALFSDRPAKRASNNPEDHRPLNVLVRQECYAWSDSVYRDILFFHFVITDLGAPLANVWVGLYTEIADIAAHAAAAQHAYDLGYHDVVVPALVSLAESLAEPDRVELTWFSTAAAAEADVYRSADGQGWARIGHTSSDGLGRLRFVD